jgi:hypothetical protein
MDALAAVLVPADTATGRIKARLALGALFMADARPAHFGGETDERFAAALAIAKQLTQQSCAPGLERNGPAGNETGNVRNGTRPKTVLTEGAGQVGIEVPRDRDGTFELPNGPFLPVRCVVSAGESSGGKPTRTGGRVGV